MKTDLTRFDFHALRFINSETVQQMSAEEVGQLILLMCQAWLGQKDASLPHNPTLLARYARVQQVSALVMSCWELGPDDRYRNPLLAEEWVAATGRAETRHEKAKKAAEARWNSEHPSSNATSMPEALLPDASNANVNSMPMQTNANSIHFNPESNGIGISSPHDFTISSGNGSSNGIGNSKPDPDQEEEFPAGKLASLFHSRLGSQAQQAAPATWRSLWAEDFKGLLDSHSEPEIARVIETLPKLTASKYYVRAKTFCENFEKIKGQATKVSKKNPSYDTGGWTPKQGVSAQKILSGIPSELDKPERGIGKKVAAAVRPASPKPKEESKPAAPPAPPVRKHVTGRVEGMPNPCYAHSVGPCNETPWVDGCDRCEAVKRFVENHEEERTISVDEL